MRTLCGLLAGTLLIAGCGSVGRAPAASSSPAGGSLEQRPLTFPRVGAAASCPVSPQVSLASASTGGAGVKSAAPDYGFGTAPAYLSGQISWYADPGGQVVLVVVDPAYSGPLLMRARRLDGRGSVVIQPDNHAPVPLRGQTGPGTAVPDGVRVDVTGAPPTWSVWDGRLTARSPGCYGLQVDGATFTSVAVFQVLPGPLPGG